MFLFKPLKILLKYIFGWIVWFSHSFSALRRCFHMPIKAPLGTHGATLPSKEGRWFGNFTCQLVAIDRTNAKPSSPSEDNEDQYFHLFKSLNQPSYLTENARFYILNCSVYSMLCMTFSVHGSCLKQAWKALLWSIGSKMAFFFKCRST